MMSLRAKKDHDLEASNCVEETLQLWEKMLTVESDHHFLLAQNVKAMQASLSSIGILSPVSSSTFQSCMR